MATIQLILNAVNNASKGIMAVATSAQAAADSVDALNGKIDDLNIALAGQTAAVTAAASRMNDLASASAKAAAGQGAAAAATAAAGGAAIIAGGGWGFLTGKIGLFGMAAATFGITWWHLIADAVIEFGITLLEAATAVVTFGAFAAPTFQHIMVQMQNIWTTSNALNTSLYPLKSSFTELAKAVQPEAYELFGEALVLVNAKTGVFAKLAQQAGLTLDQLGGRFVAAVTNGSAFGSFLSHSNQSLSMWGDIIGNVGGILGNIFRAVPGYAYVLTDALKGLTGVLETITGSGFAEWLIKIGLYGHGFIVWAGLAVTAAVLLGRAMMGVAASFMATDLAAFISLLFQVRSAEDAVALASMALDAVNPLGWIAIGVGLLAGFIALMVGASNSTSQFTKNLEQMVQNAPIQQIGTTLAGAIQAQKQQLDQATASVQRLTKQYDHLGKSVDGISLRYSQGFNPVIEQAVGEQQQAANGLQMLQQQADLVGKRISHLSKEYGGNAAAMGLMIDAGITSAQLTSTNTETWKAAEVQIQAVADSEQAMALGAGRSAAAMNALNYAGDTTNNVLGSLDVDMQKIVTGMDDITSVVLGAEQSFNGFLTGLQAFNTDAAATGAVMGAVYDSTGKLSAASITLTGDYYNTMLPAMQKVIDAMELQLPTTAQLTGAIGAMASQLYPVAKGNEAAEASLISLINGALGPGTVSFQNLASWIQKNAGNLGTLNQIIAQTTTQAGVLANTIGSDLNASFAKDILQASGAQQALATYTQDLVSNTQNTAAGQTDRQRLITDLEQAGMTAQQAAAYVQSLATNLGKVQSPPPVKITVAGYETGSQQALNLAAALGYSGASVSVAVDILSQAAGGYIAGPGTSMSDSIPALLSNGEYVMRASSVDKYGKTMMDAINGQRFATGGLVFAAGAFTSAVERMPQRFAAGGEVGQSPFSPAGITGIGGSFQVTGFGRVEQLLAYIAQDLDDLVEIAAAQPGATAAGIAAATSGRSAAYSAMYSTRG